MHAYEIRCRANHVPCRAPKRHRQGGPCPQIRRTGSEALVAVGAPSKVTKLNACGQGTLTA